MAYRNKTFVSFDGDDISYYRLMTAWCENESIDFDFHNAHDMQQARDTSVPETIKRSLRERLNNTKQVVLLVSDTTRTKAAEADSFLRYEVSVMLELTLPIICVNLNGSRTCESHRQPAALGKTYRICVPFQAKAVQYALDEFPPAFAANLKGAPQKEGCYHYKESVYERLGL